MTRLQAVGLVALRQSIEDYEAALKLLHETLERQDREVAALRDQVAALERWLEEAMQVLGEVAPDRTGLR